MPTAAALKQRSDYTHKFNATSGRHGWLRLTPAYSVRVVEQIIARYPEASRVIDPFCGTGTTALSAASHGLFGATVDINPFLVWLARAKTANYSDRDIREAKDAGRKAVDLTQTGKGPVSDAPPIHKVEKWWSPTALRFLCGLRGAIEALSPEGSAAKDLLLVAFCRTLIELSNASFNHQSMSFKSAEAQLTLVPDNASIFDNHLSTVLSSAAEEIDGSANVILGDARKLSEDLGKFDLLITSPPYANRMSYIRELRPYMYWLGYLVAPKQASDMDWLAIGGTWGSATSRLNVWKADSSDHRDLDLETILSKIQHADNANGALLSTYVEKYFYDILAHFRTVGSILVRNAEAHYIVGNSTFYGVLLPVERIYARMMEAVGFENVKVEALRKRNSKKELVEFDVSGVWRGL